MRAAVHDTVASSEWFCRDAARKSRLRTRGMIKQSLFSAASRAERVLEALWGFIPCEPKSYDRCSTFAEPPFVNTSTRKVRIGARTRQIATALAFGRA